MKLTNNVNDIAHFYFERIISPTDTVIDATCGNGHDTLILCRLASEGKVYAFDIQDAAINATKGCLVQNNISNCEVIHDSHENMQKYVTEDVKLVVFNLGYLPGADKAITTTSHSTAKALTSALSLTGSGGYITICAYRGHEGATEEFDSVMNILKDLPNREYNVTLTSFPNRKDSSPVFIMVEKLGGDR